MIGIIKEALKKSLFDVRKNSILFLPEAVYLLFLLLTATVALAATGIMPILQGLVDQPDAVIEEALRNFFFDNAAKVLTTILVFFFVNFIVGSSLEAMKLGLVAAIIKKKKADFALLLASRRYTLKVICVRVLKFIWYTVSVVAGVIVFVLVYGFHPKIAFGIGTAIALAGFLMIYLCLFYTYPHLYIKNLRAVDSLKESNRYFMKNKKRVINVAIVSSIVLLLTNILMMILDKLTMEKISFVLSLFSYIVMSVYIPLFVFHTFEGKTK